MFSVVEFQKRECAVVPYSWLLEDNTKCYWPRAGSEDVFLDFVKLKKVPKSSWAKYPVVKVFYITETFEDAEIYLKKVVEQSSSSSSDTGNNNSTTEPLFLKQFSQETDNPLGVETISNNKRSREESNTSSPNSSDNNEETTPKRQAKVRNKHVNKSFRQPLRLMSRDDSVLSSDSENEGASAIDMNSHKTLGKSSKNVSPTNVKSTKRSDATPSTRTTLKLPSPSISSSAASTVTVSSGSGLNGSVQSNTENASVLDHFGFREHIIKSLQQLLYAVNQNRQKIDEILRLQNQNLPNVEAPPDVPNFPLETTKDFKNLEEFLRNQETNRQYLKTRLACIGGPNVRACVMNMLKYLMTNKLAMKFSWAGREKRPFKNSNLMTIIIDATRHSFKNTNEDFQNRTIEDAVKDWLKLAKARYEYSQRRVP